MTYPKKLKELETRIQLQLTILKKKYNISEIDIKKFMANSIYFATKQKTKKKTLSSHELCTARKQDGDRCTRRKKGNSQYCGKHITNRPYGRFDNKNDIVEHNDKIKVRSIQIKKCSYLIDEDNILYNPFGKNGLYNIIGKLMNNQEIYYVNAT
jgi:hypothetical protein